MSIILWYGTEACLMVSSDRQFFEFTVNCLFIQIFQTRSPSVVKECQQNFNFLPIESQLQIKIAKFLQAFSATKNTLCLLFKHCALTQLSSIFCEYKQNVICSASQLARILRYNFELFRSTLYILCTTFCISVSDFSYVCFLCLTFVPYCCQLSGE